MNDEQIQDAVGTIPTSDSLSLRSHAKPSHTKDPVALPAEDVSGTQLRRDDWMLSKEDEADILQNRHPQPASSADAAGDFFSSLGTYTRQRPARPEKPNPDELQVSSRELNKQFIQGKHIDEYDDPLVKQAAAPTPGGAGSQWRMMKLRRVYEAAEEEGRDVAEVALERYGSMEAFNEARAERQFIDDQQQGRRDRGGARSGAPSRSDTPKSSAPPTRPSSRQSSFRKPGEESAPSTPGAGPAKRMSSFRQSGFDSDVSKPSTPIPSVFTPTLPGPSSSGGVAQGSSEAESSASLRTAVLNSQSHEVNSTPRLSAAALNKLSAKALRAEMMGSADAAELRAQLEKEKARTEGGGDLGFSAEGQHSVSAEPLGSGRQVQVLPTLDARGRLYDVGKANPGKETEATAPGNRRKRERFETRDPKTGEVVRYNADDDEQTLADLVREERFGAGSASQKNMDAQMADRIMGDKAFKDSVDYMDDNVERLGRRKLKSDAMKRMFAVQDFAKTKKALDSCSFCWQEDHPPRATVVSSGTRSYLALPDAEPLVPGHCLIVPMQHHLSMLEADEDTWEEVKNFMKCLIQMAAAQQRSFVFYETVKSLKQQRHTFIEAVPVDHDLFSQLPGYFRQSILDAGDEWSQNKRLIEFSSSRPFRRSMVPDLPYFMVQWDHRGEKGYGHVIEDQDGYDGPGGGDGWALDERTKGSGDFPRWFAAEIIGNQLDYEPRRWRKPRKLHGHEHEKTLKAFQSSWAPYDWTGMLDEQQR